MIKTGTNHFETLYAAERYYKAQGEGKKEVQQKIKEKLIVIGPPKVGHGQKLQIHKTEGRYFIVEQ